VVLDLDRPVTYDVASDGDVVSVTLGRAGAAK